MCDPPPFRLADCWAKTDPATGKPALTVRDHSLIATMVSGIILGKLPPACRSLPPDGTKTLIGLHHAPVPEAYQTRAVRRLVSGELT